MDPVYIGAWLSLLAMIAGLLWKVIKLRDAARDLAAQTRRDHDEFARKVNVMWRFLNQRAKLALEEESTGGLMLSAAHREHKITLPKRVYEAFADLAPKLRMRYQESWQFLDEDALALEIQAEFGDEIIRDVCRPLGWNDGKCLQAAAIIAQESPII